MFEIGFLELVVVGIVSLVVLGPERLPGAIRTVSLWVGRLRRSFNNVKRDIDREIGADEIRRQLRNEDIMEKFKQTKAQVQDTIDTVKKEAEELRKSADLESQAASLTSQDSPAADKAAESPPPGAAVESTPAADTASTADPAAITDTATTTDTAPAAPQPADESTKAEP